MGWSLVLPGDHVRRANEPSTDRFRTASRDRFVPLAQATHRVLQRLRALHRHPVLLFVPTLAGGPPITLAARGACWPCERDALPMTGGTAAPTSQGTTRRSAAGARTSRAFRYCRPGRAALPRSTRPIRHPPQQFQIDICYRAPIPLPEDRARPTNGSDRGEHDLTLVVEHVVSYG